MAYNLALADRLPLQTRLFYIDAFDEIDRVILDCQPAIEFCRNMHEVPFGRRVTKKDSHDSNLR